MAQVEVYSKDFCPYCVKAKNLLKTKGVEFVEYDITNDDAKRDEMLTRAAPRRSVPQIFINGKAIGGCDDLFALEDGGRLAEMLEEDLT